MSSFFTKCFFFSTFYTRNDGLAVFKTEKDAFSSHKITFPETLLPDTFQGVFLNAGNLCLRNSDLLGNFHLGFPLHKPQR